MPENKNQQPVLTEEERKILDQSYALAALRGAAAGGVLGGAAFGGAPLLYGMDSNNPRADFEKDFPNTLRTSAITGGVGTILGAGTGALLNSAALARRKKKIRRKVTDDYLAMLPKTAAARDYITRGLGGAAIGTGAGIAANALLGKKWYDWKMLLGGLGMGTAVGLGIGHRRAQEREMFEKSLKHMEDNIQRKPDGKPVLVNGQKRFKPGWYIQAVPIDAVQGIDPSLENSIQHFTLVGYSDRPINKTYTVDGKTWSISSRPLKNGQHAIAFETSPLLSDTLVHPLKDTRMQADINSTNRYNSREGGLLYYGTESESGTEILNGTAHPSARMYALATYDPNNEKDMARFNKGIDLLAQRSLRHHGYLGNWNILPSTDDTRSRNTCISWVHYLTRGLIDSGAIPEPDWEKFPARMSGFANEDFTKTHDRYEGLYGPFQPGS
ncbi:MAG: hypothetical protein IJV70_07460 [Clostridia bacterium]|nr:hypothetical protein [Clostridia bacterium]